MRVAVTIAERSPGQWEVIGGPGSDIDDQKKAIKALPMGDQKAFILSTSGVLKRRRVDLPTSAPRRKVDK